MGFDGFGVDFLNNSANLSNTGRLNKEYISAVFNKISQNTDKFSSEQLFKYSSKPDALGNPKQPEMLDLQTRFFQKYAGDDMMMDATEFQTMCADAEYEEVARKLAQGGFYNDLNNPKSEKNGALYHDSAAFMSALVHKAKTRTEFINDENKDLIKLVYSQYIKEIYTEKSTNPDVIELENKMQELGVHVTFADDKATAEAVYNACKLAHDRGAKLPKEIVLVDFQREISGFTAVMEDGYEENATVFYMKGLGSKTNFDAEDSIAKMIKTRHSVNETPVGVVLHELGHYNNNLNNPNAKRLNGKDYIEECDINLARKVSYYAVKDRSAQEFAAEVFCGLMSGETYDEEVMNLYHTIGGLPVK